MQWLEPRPSRRVPIRLTPLIDVVFILLLFFMLTSRMEPIGLLQLDTPSPETGGQASDDPPARLHLTAEALQWNGEALEKPQLRDRIRGYNGKRIEISTEEGVALGRFTHWLGVVDEAGVSVSWERDGPKGADTP
ncbi:ExbD/TolR family protein [Halomonadaceae bacterium KBTZ08]